MSRKDVLTDSNMLSEKALDLHEDFSKGSPEPSDTKPFTARKGWSQRFRNRLGLKNRKTTGEAASAYEEPAVTFPSEWRRLLRVRYYPRFQASTGRLGTYPAGNGGLLGLGTWMAGGDMPSVPQEAASAVEECSWVFVSNHIFHGPGGPQAGYLNCHLKLLTGLFLRGCPKAGAPYRWGR